MVHSQATFKPIQSNLTIEKKVKLPLPVQTPKDAFVKRKKERKEL